MSSNNLLWTGCCALLGILLFYSCGIIGIKGGKVLKQKNHSTSISYDEMSPYLQDFSLTLDSIYKTNWIYIIDDDRNITDTIGVYTVVRNYHPLGGLANENHKTLYKSGHHIKYKGERYVLHNGNFRGLRFIYRDQLYYTHEFRLESRTSEGYKTLFYIMDLSG